LQRGALVTVDNGAGRRGVIAFQYNPATLTRTLTPKSVAGADSRGEPYRLGGAPQEKIDVEVEIDATDPLEQGNARARTQGIYPELSALEMLVYPPSSRVIANTALLSLGTIEVLPPAAPLTLFVWGPRRVVPVRVADLRITEEAHDERLNPVRATVALGLQVLSYDDLPLEHAGRGIFLSHQVLKEALAAVGAADSLPGLPGRIPGLRGG
jgi:hypothetical protein